jgi:YcxB-like protein
LRFRLQPEDYIAAQGLHMRSARKRAMLLGAAALLIGLLLLLLHEQWSVIFGCGLIGGTIGGAISQTIVRSFVLPRRARRRFAQQKSLHGEVQFDWDEDGLAWATERGSGKTPWGDYLKWREDDRFILLYQTDVLFQMVPKRAFANAHEKDDFLSCLGTRSVG